MTDNTQLNPGSGGDIIRDLNRTGTVKTQVVQLDIGGAVTNSEVLVTAGQQTSANSLPVTIASDQAQPQVQVLLQAILIELRIHSLLMQQLVINNEDLDLLRNDPALLQQLPQ